MAKSKKSSLALVIPASLRFRDAFVKWESLHKAGRDFNAISRAGETALEAGAVAHAEIRLKISSQLERAEGAARECIAALWGFQDWSEIPLDCTMFPESQVHRLPVMQIVAPLRGIYFRREGAIWKTDILSAAKLMELIDEFHRVFRISEEMIYQISRVSDAARNGYEACFKKFGMNRS